MSTAPTAPAAAETTAVTVLLTNAQTAMLDEIALAIRRKSGAVISRSAMIRAFIAAALPHRDWWLHAKSEESLRESVSLRMVIALRQQEDRNNEATRRAA
jgi:hypothetical protein